MAAPTRASHCSCGRPALAVLDGGEWGPTGYCGYPQPPLDPCRCGKGAERHDRSVCHVYGVGMVDPFDAIEATERYARDILAVLDALGSSGPIGPEEVKDHATRAG